ncbi:MAG: cadherin-like domain-containing protein, partial [Acidobacteriota bacterium]
MKAHGALLIGVLITFSFLPLSLQATTLQVEGPQDSLAGAPTINHCTLRKAVINSNNDAATYPQCASGSGLDTIEFLSPMTVTFALAGAGEEAALTGDLDVTQSLVINGGGSTVDGAALDRVFHIHPGITVTINDLHIRNGSGNGGGGGILVDGATLNLNNVTISASHSPGGDGGAIWVRNGGTLNLTSCTISGNVANGHAGAINVEGATATITNSTITGNSSTFANLTGGIRNTGTTNLRNTIVAGNAGTDLPNLDGTFVSQGYNGIGNLGTAVGNPTIPAATGDQIGVSDAVVHLGSLQNNGGPTPTHALLAGSVALDKGHSSGSATDQRGLTRPCDDAALTNAPGGDGADVGAYEEQVACSNTPPDAVDDTASVAEDSGANSIAVLANDSDPNAGDVLSVVGVTQGAHGSVAISGGGSAVTYTPSANFFGSDTFTYTIDDGHSATDTASVFVTVTNVEDPPD